MILKILTTIGLKSKFAMLGHGHYFTLSPSSLPVQNYVRQGALPKNQRGSLPTVSPVASPEQKEYMHRALHRHLEQRVPLYAHRVELDKDHISKLLPIDDVVSSDFLDKMKNHIDSIKGFNPDAAKQLSLLHDFAINPVKHLKHMSSDPDFIKDQEEEYKNKQIRHLDLYQRADSRNSDTKKPVLGLKPSAKDHYNDMLDAIGYHGIRARPGTAGQLGGGHEIMYFKSKNIPVNKVSGKWPSTADLFPNRKS